LKVSSLVKVPCSIESTPARSAALMPFTPWAWTGDLASEGARGLDNGAHLVIGHLLVEPAGNIASTPPVAMNLITSAPSRICSRVARRQSSAPLQTPFD
jgi:hypothetical protein